MKWSLFVFIAWLMAALGLGSGCSFAKGTSGPFDQANPSTSVAFNPWSGTVEFFTNDGREVHTTGLTLKRGTDGLFEMSAETLEVTEKSVELREVNVDQIAASESLMVNYTKAHWSGAAELLKSFGFRLVSTDTPLGNHTLEAGGSALNQNSDSGEGAADANE